jgi:phosphatidylinositol alpha-1,6-mannosyltransferase
MQPRILIVTSDYPPRIGGIQVVMHELCRRLDPARLHVIAPAYDGDTAHDGTWPWTVTRVRPQQIGPTPRMQALFHRVCDEFRPDVVCFGSALPTSLLAGAALHRGLPWVTFVYGAEMAVPALAPGVRSLLGRTAAEASGLVATGTWVAEVCRELAAPRPVAPTLVMLPGVDADRFRPGDAGVARRRLGLDPDRPTITSVSRLVPRKGMHLLVGAAAKLRRRHPDLQVAIAGSGREHDRLAMLVDRLDLAGCVRLLGRVDDDVLPDVHRAADVATLLCQDRWFGAEQEGFGIVLVEAAACGVPVVAGRSGGTGDGVIDDVTGILVDARDLSQVVEAFDRYLSDPDVARAAGLAARRHVLDAHSWDRQVATFVDWLAQRARVA